MNIYTKTGDNGETSLCGCERVEKDSPRIEACGTVDELCATLGVALAAVRECVCKNSQDIAAVISRIQRELFLCGGEIASRDPARLGTKRIADRHVAALETDIDRTAAALAPLREFVIPGDVMASAQLHVARTVCRRAERRLATLAKQPGETVSPLLPAYLNRLSDLLFVLARAAETESE